MLIPIENESRIRYGLSIYKDKLKKFNISNLAIDSIQDYEMLKDSLLVLDKLYKISEQPCQADMNIRKLDLDLIKLMLLSCTDNLNYKYEINKELLK